jgi:hypothetical protein
MSKSKSVLFKKLTYSSNKIWNQIQIQIQNQIAICQYAWLKRVYHLIFIRYTVEKNWDFLTSFSLSNKSTYLAFKISYQRISEINVKAKFCGFHFHGKFGSEKPLTTSILWKNFDQKVVSAGKWGMVAAKLWIFCGLNVIASFRFFFDMKFSFSEEYLSISLL